MPPVATLRGLRLVGLSQHLMHANPTATAVFPLPLRVPCTDVEAKRLLPHLRNAPLLTHVRTPDGVTYCPVLSPTTWVSAAILAAALEKEAFVVHTLSVDPALHRCLVHAPPEAPGSLKGIDRVLQAVRWGMRPARCVVFEHCVSRDVFLMGGARREWRDADRQRVNAWKQHTPCAPRDAAFEERLITNAAFIKRVLAPLHRMAH